MMMKRLIGAVVLLSVALWTGCATGGSGHPSDNIKVTITTQDNQQFVGVTLPLVLTAAVTGTDNTAVTWTFTQAGVACTAACGTLVTNGLTATYTAPTTVPPNPKVDVTATSVANTAKSATLELTVLPITVSITPGPKANVGINLQQQFAAPVTPDAAPQTVTWTPLTGAVCPTTDCGNVDTNGLYTAPGSIPTEGPFQIQATSTIDSPNWVGATTVTVVSSRLSGRYAFRFSGYDNANKPVAIAGNFVANANGTIASGAQDELTASGHKHCAILSSSGYAPSNSNGTSHNSNNHGTLTLNTTSGACSVNSRIYKIVLSADGNGHLLEFGDGAGRGSGNLAVVATTTFNNGLLSGGFVFGLAGFDPLTFKRAGSAGFFAGDGSGNITTPGNLDINDAGAITSSSNVTGSYSVASDGSGTLSLTDNTRSETYQFAIYVAGGKFNNTTIPLNLFMISTDPLSNHPGVVGTIILQDDGQTFDKSALNDFVVTNLTGVDSTGNHTQVSLTSARGDSNGNFSASYDANNAGTVLAAKTFNSTYSATGSGRYTVDWLNPAVHFVLYLSDENKGFMLEIDTKSPNEVYTGSMDPQPGSSFATSEMVGTLDAATGSSGSSAATPLAMNMFNTVGTLTSYTVGGVQDQTGQGAPQNLAGTGTFDLTTSTGQIVLTQPVATTYVVYPVDNPKPSFLILHFEMIDVTSGQTDPTIIFGER